MAARKIQLTAEEWKTIDAWRNKRDLAKERQSDGRCARTEHVTTLLLAPETHAVTSAQQLVLLFPARDLIVHALIV